MHPLKLPSTPVEAVALLRTHIAALEAYMADPATNTAHSASFAAVAVILRTYEHAAPSGARLDNVWGLRAHGQPSWWTAEARARGVALVQQFAAEACRGLTQAATVKAVKAAVNRARRASRPLQGPDALIAEAMTCGDAAIPTTARGITRKIDRRCRVLLSEPGSQVRTR